MKNDKCILENPKTVKLKIKTIELVRVCVCLCVNLSISTLVYLTQDLNTN